MQPNALLKDEHVRDYADTAKYLLGYFAWELIAIAFGYIALYIFKDDIADWYAGRKWKKNVEYRRLDQVYFYQWKELGVIEYIDTKCSAFTMYTISDDGKKITGGRSIIISNAELAKMQIARLKPHFGDPSQLPDFILKDLGKR